jgi:hypothetical protein
MSEGTPTPQINVSKIPGGTGIAGALFALGSMLIFLVGVPRIRFFFVAAVVLGVGIALVLRFIRRETPGKPWILPATQDATGTNSTAQGTSITSNRPEDLRRKLRTFSPAWGHR